MSQPTLSQPHYVLTIASPDRPGIVAAVTTHLFETGGNILEAQQFDDEETDRFFMRVVFAPSTESGTDFEREFRDGFGTIADRFGMEWTLRDRAEKKRVMLLVSKFDHCLADLLYRWRTGELPMDDHRDRLQPSARDLCGDLDFGDIPLPPPAGHHADQDASRRPRSGIWCSETRTDLVVLARYMQILSDELHGKAVGPLHQHPPLVPAGLQGRQALSPGA